METVLVVSPSRALRLLLGRLLPHWGFAVTALENGDEAFSRLAGEMPLALIADLRPSELEDDGSLFVGLLRRRFPSLPVVVLLPSHIRWAVGAAERVVGAPSSPGSEDLHPLLTALRDVMDEILADAKLRVWRPPLGQA